MSTGLSDSYAKLASEEGVEEKCSQKVMRQLAKTFPFPKHENRDIWLGYLLPTRSVLECCVHSFDEEVLLCNVAESYRILGNFREVEFYVSAGSEAERKATGKEHPELLEYMMNIGNMLLGQGKYKEA